MPEDCWAVPAVVWLEPDEPQATRTSISTAASTDATSRVLDRPVSDRATFFIVFLAGMFTAILISELYTAARNKRTLRQ